MSRSALQLVDRHRLSYLVRPPISTVADESPSLLCFLHGYDEGAPVDIVAALSRHGPLRSLYNGSFVIVAPQLPVRGDMESLCGHGAPNRSRRGGEICL